MLLKKKKKEAKLENNKPILFFRLSWVRLLRTGVSKKKIISSNNANARTNSL